MKATFRRLLTALFLAATPATLFAQAGTLDTGFNAVLPMNPYGLAVQPNGMIAVANHASAAFPQYCFRLNPGGTLDTIFSPGANDRAMFATVLGDGKVLYGGDFTAPGFHLTRYVGAGTADAGFSASADLVVHWAAVQPDGKFIIGGNFNTVGGVNRFKVARLNANGSLDTTFPNPSVLAQVWSGALQPDGKVVIGGSFTSSGGLTRNFVARLNADGTTDAFNPNANGTVYTVALQADGKVIIAGDFTQVGGVTRNRIARVNADGTLDTGFNPNLNNIVQSTVVQADRKILVGGWFTTVGGVTRTSIARLTTTGALDTTFPAVTMNGVLVSAALQADGRVLLGGNFTTVNTVSRQSFARLLNDPATQALTIVDTGRVHWLRGGSAPETHAVTFELSTDGGTSWTPIGVGTRTAGGWEKTGLALPASGTIRARARTAGGYFNGSSGLVEQTAAFTGLIQAPAAVTLAANPITTTGATLRGTVDPNSGATMAQFEWGTGTGYGNTTTPQNVGSGTAPVAINAPLAGLLRHTTYHYRVVATNVIATSNGDDMTFTTANTVPVANPETVELPMDHFNVKANDTDGDLDPLMVTAVGAGLRGTPTLNADNTVSYTPGETFGGSDSFTYTISDGFGGTTNGTVTVTDTTPPVIDTVPPEQTLVASAALTAPMPDLSGLTAFHDNSGLVTFSETPTAGTPLPLGDTNATIKVTDNAGLMATANVTIHVVAPPTVVTGAASGITTAGVTLNASVSPNRMPTTAFFEYGTTTGYGSTTPIQSLGDGASAVPLAAELSGLPPHTEYHFRVVATNGTGTTIGEDAMFITGDSSPEPGPDVILIVTNPTRTISPLTNDTDAEGDPLTVTGATNGAKGTAAFTADSVTYTAATLGIGTDTFEYTVGDGFGGSANGTVKVFSIGSQAGFYSGLIDGAVGVDGASQITMNTSGALTGRIHFGGLRYALRGQVDENGEATIQISRNDQALVLLHLALVPGDAPTFHVEIEQHGTIEGSGDAERSGTNTPGRRRYTLLLPPDPAQAGSDAIPQGTGFARVSFSSRGKILIVGVTGDGAKFSTASAVRTDNTFPFFAPIYNAPRGELYGTLTVRDVPDVSDLDGVLTWNKPVQRHPNRVGPASFTTTTEAIGSLYAQPKPAIIRDMLDLNATGDAEVSFSEGNLASPLSASIRVRLQNPPTVTPPILGMVFRITNGVFVGNFTRPGLGKTRFEGVVFQKQNRGAGFFIGTDRSGAVEITPAP